MNQELKCDPQRIQRFLDDAMSAQEQDMFEDHLDDCAGCCQLLEDSTADRTSWDDVATHLVATPELLSMTTLEPGKKRDISLDFLGPTDDPNMMGRFAGYEIAGVIGIGGMGIVLKGFDRALNRYVAIKVLLPHYASSAAARKRFAREARAAAAVVHDNVIAIHSVSADISDSDAHDAELLNSKALPFLVMPYLRGESLQKRLDRCGSLPLPEILRIAIQIAEGLSAAHEQGLVHRDIKPANILLPDDVERVTITDFGLARAADDASLTRTGVIAGTPQYMSPEQADGRPVSSRTDLFSLGSLMYVMCTGRIPFRAETPVATLRRILDDEPTAIRELNPEIPEWLCDLIGRLHAKDAEDRPTDAGEVARTLKAFLAHIQTPTSKPLPKFNKSAAVRNRIRQFLTQPAGWITMFATVFLVATSIVYWPPATPVPSTITSPSTVDKNLNVIETNSKMTTEGDLKKTFRVAFADAQKPGKLVVDIKRGVIRIVGHDADEIVVQLTVPKYNEFESKDQSGLKTIRSNNLDFEIEGKGNQIKVDANSQQFVTNLEIKVPRSASLDLDTYYDGRIVVDEVGGDIKARSQNCSIELSGVEGAVDAYAYNGNLNVTVKHLANKPYRLESYNGNIGLGLPENEELNRQIEFRSGTGKVKTDIEFAVSERVTENEGGSVKVQFDEWRRGKIGNGGPLIRLETEKGDIVFRRIPSSENEFREKYPPGIRAGKSEATADSSDLQKQVQSREWTHQEITKLVKGNKMPEYLLHAAKAGWLEAKREMAISELKIDEAYRLEAELILTYEKAIFSYKSMQDDKEWRKRFPGMNPKDVKPYQTKLDFYKSEMAKRSGREK